MTVPPGIVECRGVSVTFSRWGQTIPALSGFSIEVPDGQWLMVVGANGSGKSTLLRVLSGLIVPAAGEVLIGGAALPLLPLAERAQRVFQVHQNPLKGTAPSLTVFENLLIADPEVAASRPHRREQLAKFTELLSQVGLAGQMGQSVGTLSGGERQLLALTIAGLRPAAVLLLDEPTAALDPARAAQCLQLIQQLSDCGKTIIHVTHDMKQASALGHRTVALRGGCLLADLDSTERRPEAIRALWIKAEEGVDGGSQQ